jgi:RimJ/RimL family protein N-acetyltransferase
MKITDFNESDKPILEAWMKDKSVLYNCITEQSNPNLLAFSYAIRHNDQLIGWANLFNIDTENERAEFGIAIPDKHVKLAGWATIQILKFAFQDLKLNRIYLRPLASSVKPENDVRDKFGFVREGIERQAVKRGDIYEDVIVFSMLKNEFERKWFKCH